MFICPQQWDLTAHGLRLEAMSNLRIVVLDVSVCSIRIIQKLVRNANNFPTLLEDLSSVQFSHSVVSQQSWFQLCVSSSPPFLMMYSAYKLNKQGDNIQPWCIPFPIWSQSVVPCSVLTVASWPAYRFLKRQVRWSGIPISLRIFHSLLWSTQSKALA